MPDSNPDATQQMTAPPSEPEPPTDSEAAPTPRSASRLSVPPSEPRSSRASIADLDAAVDRPARLQMIVALVLGLVLVAIPLYLWRRPRAESVIAARANTDAGLGNLQTITPPDAAPADDKVTLGELHVLSCHDSGPKKTPPEQCDHVAEVEKAFAKAIEENAACVPKDAGGGTIQYVADVSFKKHGATVSVPKDGRTFKNHKVATNCATVVKSRLAALPFESVTHAHARYKLAITATYPGAVKP